VFSYHKNSSCGGLKRVNVTEDLDGGEYLFAIRMLMVLFRREFSFLDALYLWEVMTNFLHFFSWFLVLLAVIVYEAVRSCCVFIIFFFFALSAVWVMRIM
jgi:hypothetical protein